MLCKFCGTELEEGACLCPACGNSQAEVPAEEMIVQESEEISAQKPVEEAAPAPVKAPKVRKKPHIALRIPLQLFSLILCIALLAVSICTVLLADLNMLTSAGGINKLINSILSPAAAPAPHRFIPGAVGVWMDSTDPSIDMDDLLDGDGNIVLPDGVLDGEDSDEAVGSLIDYVIDSLEESMGGELPVTDEQISYIVENSTLTEFVSQKIASIAEDVLNGTKNTVFTTEEIMELMEQNKGIIEEVFDFTITAEITDQIQKEVDKLIVEQDINNQIHDSISNMVDEAIKDSLPPISGSILDGVIPGGSDLDPEDTLGQYMALIGFITSNELLFGAIGVCLVLILLLCLLNWYNVPAGLTWSAFPMILSGLILSAPIYMVQNMPQLLLSILGDDAAMLLQIIQSFVGVFAPIHYGLLGLGAALLIGSIVWRIVRASIRKRKAA